MRLRGLPAGWDEVTQVTQWPLQGPKCLSLKACSVLGAASSSGPQNAPARSRTAPVSEPPRLPRDCLLQGDVVLIQKPPGASDSTQETCSQVLPVGA